MFAFFILTPFLVESSERARRGGGGIIETGDAQSDSIAVNRMNISRTRTNTSTQESTQQEVIVQSASSAVVQNDASSDANTGGNSTNAGNSKSNMEMTQISLRDLGLLQLAAHDFFNVDRMTEIDHENGDLDLSTLLDHGDEYIAIGGEPRNRENIMLFTVSSEYGELYLKFLDRGNTPFQARKKLVRKYHNELQELYEELFHEDFPEPAAGVATMTENLAFRTIHDFLPGHIYIDGEPVITVDHSLVGKKLSRKELKAKSGKLDGVFDPVFRDIVIFIPPSIIFHIDLLERDSSFGTQFSTDHTFEYFLSELADGSFDEDEAVMYYIRNLFAKGLYLD